MWVNVKLVAEEVMVLNVESYRVILSMPSIDIINSETTPILFTLDHIFVFFFPTLVLSQSRCTLLFFFFFLIIARQIVLIGDQIREYLKTIVQVIPFFFGSNTSIVQVILDFLVQKKSYSKFNSNNPIISLPLF